MTDSILVLMKGYRLVVSWFSRVVTVSCSPNLKLRPLRPGETSARACSLVVLKKKRKGRDIERERETEGAILAQAVSGSREGGLSAPFFSFSASCEPAFPQPGSLLSFLRHSSSDAIL